MNSRRSWFLLPCALSLVITAFPRTVAAQTPYQCTVNVAIPRLARPQGLTEQVGDIVLSCGGTAPQTGIVGTLTVILNTDVTNRLLSGSVSDALLLVDEPSPGAQALGVNVFEGTVSTFNSITFAGVQFADAPGGNVSRTFRITNIRANAVPFSPSSVLVAFVSIPSIPVQNPQHTVASVVAPVAFSVTPRSFSLCTDPQATVDLHFAESDASDLKVQGGTGQSTPGAIYHTETGFTPDPVIAGVGTADSGTQLFATFTGIPTGVDLSVPASVTNAALTVTAIDPPGGGPVSIAAGTATIVYEVTAAQFLVAESVSIPVTVSYPSPVPSLVSTVDVQGGLGPISTVTTASSSAPIPRFADESTALPAFSIQACSEIPTLNAEASSILVLVLLGLGIFVLRRT